MNIIVGSHVWVEDPKQAWIGGEVTKVNGEEVHVCTADGKTVSQTVCTVCICVRNCLHWFFVSYIVLDYENCFCCTPLRV